MLALALAPAGVAAQQAAPIAAAPSPVSSSTAERVAARLAEAGAGVRFGLVVLDEAGNELIALNPDGRFIPGSNTKMATTAAALWLLSGEPAAMAAGEGTRVRLSEARVPDVVLEGRGDPWLSAAPGCARDCLAVLADAVAARTRRVRNVIGDARWFADERWPAGMSWNNIPSRSGTATAALSLDDNELVLTVSPGDPGGVPEIDGPPYLTIDNRAVTLAPGVRPTPGRALALHRDPLARRAVLTGEIAAAAPPATLRQGIDDPAHYAAWTLARMLAERGVRVTGEVRSAYRAPGEGPPAESPAAPLAVLAPPPLAEAVTRINKDSQNHHADVLLRRIGRAGGGDGTAEAGQAVVRALYAAAGVPEDQGFFADGSGMSTYNRMTPRGTARLVRWIARQPWGAAFEASLPVAGRDGTLANRFRGTLLEGRLMAKTGSLNATNALSGWLITRSGRRLAFAMFANDVPEGVSGTAAIDGALAILAED
ncbi:MAG: D-alanyl-D-alanine carboxypeptidase/D-alanyl-D-alanine-endopeptidase [Sphingomonadales bacterium 32-68-7]|nr:MAG: D-alanyl-D-alanine carboxypeptidase/D-alanyl-D-alanine-endopeptidase [Sphingomonadales bacterium 12-68-11]OYX09740.1 MAG: D-alanyl-D-alanine carboxypeptidase/D-alanyl-D-alanine-endopeptidase [Sphingomonadales bacterium 32-68-7]